MKTLMEGRKMDVLATTSSGTKTFLHNLSFMQSAVCATAVTWIVGLVSGFRELAP